MDEDTSRHARGSGVQIDQLHLVHGAAKKLRTKPLELRGGVRGERSSPVDSWPVACVACGSRRPTWLAVASAESTMGTSPAIASTTTPAEQRPQAGGSACIPGRSPPAFLRRAQTLRAGTPSAICAVMLPSVQPSSTSGTNSGQAFSVRTQARRGAGGCIGVRGDRRLRCEHQRGAAGLRDGCRRRGSGTDHAHQRHRSVGVQATAMRSAEAVLQAITISSAPCSLTSLRMAAAV